MLNYFLSLRLVELIAGTVLKGAESALKLEERRLQMYNEVVGKDFDSKMASQSVSHRWHALNSHFLRVYFLCILCNLLWLL